MYSDPPPRLFLASASPRRRHLLEQAGVRLRVHPADVLEAPRPGERPADFTRRAARDKAEAVAGQVDPGAWVLAADTTVVIDQQILGKPADPADAERMLRLLSGRDHRVLTAVVLQRAAAGDRMEHLAETTVSFRPLTDALIRGYIGTKEPLDKAGSYGIQGLGAMLVRAIQGSYTNVVGLPLCETVELLERAGLYRPFEGDVKP